MLLKSSLAGLLISLLAVFAGTGGDDEKKEKNYVFVTSSAGAQVNVDGQMITAEDLEIGETRIIETEDGETVEVSRNEDGFTIHKGDKTTRIDLSGEGDGTSVRVIADGQELDLDSFTDIKMEKFMPHNSVTISGLDDLDEEARERIRQALQDAGVDKEIHFNNHKMMWFDNQGGSFNLGSQSFMFHSDDHDEDGNATVEIKSDGGKVFVIKKKN